MSLLASSLDPSRIDAKALDGSERDPCEVRLIRVDEVIEGVGTTTLGTRSAGARPAATQASPIACVSRFAY